MQNDEQDYTTWQDVKNAFRSVVANVWFSRANYEARHEIKRHEATLRVLGDVMALAVFFASAAFIGWMAASL